MVPAITVTKKIGRGHAKWHGPRYCAALCCKIVGKPLLAPVLLPFGLGLMKDLRPTVIINILSQSQEPTDRHSTIPNAPHADRLIHSCRLQVGFLLCAVMTTAPLLLIPPPDSILVTKSDTGYKVSLCGVAISSELVQGRQYAKRNRCYAPHQQHHGHHHHQKEHEEQEAGVGPLGLLGVFQVLLQQLHVARVGLTAEQQQ